MGEGSGGAACRGVMTSVPAWRGVLGLRGRGSVFLVLSAELSARCAAGGDVTG
jgi:hypothetical protein